MNKKTKNINLFKSLFKGREDVFAIRWEKGKKSGYMPAYHFDPYRYRAHKMRGGSFQNFSEKRHLPLSDEQITNHLNGEQLIGLYPLLPNNTSWFIAADFDKDNWKEECQLFLSICEKNEIPAYLERSQSGNGGHVWIFFEEVYPANKSRRIFIRLLEQCGAFSIFEKTSSFDRLFPNQDYLSGKGFGNLIALPLYGPKVKSGNSCFIDHTSFIPYENQWEFLEKVKKVSVKNLDRLNDNLLAEKSKKHSDLPQKLTISLDQLVKISRFGISPILIKFLKVEFNIANAEYFIKKKTGKNTWNIKKYFNLIEEEEEYITLPRGGIGRILRFCKEQKIDFEFSDNRKKSNPIFFNTELKLRDYQNKVLEQASKKDFGVIIAPPGTGKTVIALKIVAEKQQPALIIVHRKLLLEQWLERIEAFLKIPKREIGKIGQGKAKIGKQITIAMIQSLGKKELDQEIKNTGKTIIIDECHHIPAKSYSNIIAGLEPYYQYGLTATPFRKNNEGKLIFSHLGEMIAEIKPHEIESYKKPRVVVRNTQFEVPFDSKTDVFEDLSKMLIHDSIRNKQIIEDVTQEILKGKKAVIITERKEHVKSLYQFLKQSFEVITISGEDSEKDKTLKWNILKSGDYQVMITTGQYFGEGSDLQNVNILFLAYPFSFKGKLIQYIGRVQRSEIIPVIYDYHDYKIEYLHQLFLKRNIHYRNLDKQATLFDDPIEDTTNIRKVFSIKKRIKVTIEKLEFHYGSVAFKYKEKSIPFPVEFVIDHEFIRPEFEVLKSYFSKILGSKKIEFDIEVVLENGIVVAQNATASALEKLNREIIESVRFKYIEKQLFGKKKTKKPEVDSGEARTAEGLFSSNEDLLNEILAKKNIKHYSQLKYLAVKHKSNIIKLRFLLNPFAFVFLLEGVYQYHIVLETLDTEEATYIWHFEKSELSLKNNLQSIDRDLAVIKNKGRHAFLESQPQNFSKINHDYSEPRKGFIQWRDLLEERIY